MLDLKTILCKDETYFKLYFGIFQSASVFIDLLVTFDDLGKYSSLYSAY